MNSLVVLCVALVAFQSTHAQVIRSLAPSIIGGINNCGCSSSILAPAIPSCSSPILAPAIPSCSSPILAPTIPSCPSSIIAPAIPSPIITAVPVVQQNSVAASLADTLSLLTVSSLLSETLPLGANMVLPPCGCGLGYGGIYY